MTCISTLDTVLGSHTRSGCREYKRLRWGCCRTKDRQQSWELSSSLRLKLPNQPRGLCRDRGHGKARLLAR